MTCDHRFKKPREIRYPHLQKMGGRQEKTCLAGSVVVVLCPLCSTPHLVCPFHLLKTAAHRPMYYLPGMHAGIWLAHIGFCHAQIFTILISTHMLIYALGHRYEKQPVLWLNLAFVGLDLLLYKRTTRRCQG